LARHDIPVIAIASDPDHHCCRTNVCQEIHYADSRSPEFLDTLREIAPRLKEKAVLFPCSDPPVLVISAHRAELQEHYHIALSDEDVVEMLMDKVRFYSYAQEHGFAIPKTFILRERSDAIDAIDQLEFPGLLKPSIRLPAWDQQTKLKAFKVADGAELLALYDKCSEWTDQLILQQWIEGGDNSLYSCNCYFDAKSEPLATFVAQKIRQWPPGVGYSSLGEECRDDFVLQETLRLFSSVQYRGLGYVEFKRDTNTGKQYIIEPNVGRPTGRSAIAEAGGVELLYTMYCDLIGLPLPAERVQRYRGAKWIDLRHDFQSAFHYWRKGELSLADWWRSWRGKKAFAYFSMKDPAPFLYDIYRSARRIMSREKDRA
jgi:predicted ATP-grasp superfamily ATP-dependent carboligase